MPETRIPRSARTGFKPITVGKTLRHRGDVIPCQSGLHFCRDIVDAVREFCYGPVLSLVECSGTIVDEGNKSVCSVRKHVWMRDMTRELHEFACFCAESAMRRAKVKDRRSWKAIEIKRLWLDGKASDDDLAAARAAAWDAARAAADAAAWDAARAAAWAAADAAADAAAWDAARAAVWDAAWDAAIKEQRAWWIETLRSLDCPAEWVTP